VAVIFYADESESTGEVFRRTETMTDFIRVGMRSEEIPSFLTVGVAGFKDSFEYGELRDYEGEIVGVVCGAFAKYVCRLAKEHLSAERSHMAALSSAHAAIEAMAASPATEIQALITDEVFENFDCEPAVLETITRDLKPNAAALYSHWKAGIL